MHELIVEELIAALQELPPKAVVNFYDNDYETGGYWFAVTSLDLSVDEDNRNVYIRDA
jgi:hypothetical protein